MSAPRLLEALGPLAEQGQAEDEEENDLESSEHAEDGDEGDDGEGEKREIGAVHG